MRAHAAGKCNGWQEGTRRKWMCGACWKDRNPATLLPGKSDGSTRTASHKLPATPDAADPTRVSLPVLRSEMACEHLGAVAPGQTCGCQAKFRECGVHGRCTVGVDRGVACCATCGDFSTAVSADYGDGYRRHLLYYAYPVAGNGLWQRNLDQLKKRLSLFNGRRVIAVSTNSRRHALDSPDLVRAYFGATEADFLYVPHRRKLGEVTAFSDLWKRVQRYQGERDVTFYGHTKGVTKPVNPGISVHRWADLMYGANLDHWPDVRDLLQRHPVVGAFKKTGRCFGGMGDWHYTGTFYWARNRDVFAKPNWANVPQMYGGTELWPAKMWPASESGCVFYDGEGYLLYDLGEIGRAEAMYRCWNPGARRNG